jgi:hypothetical protein
MERIRFDEDFKLKKFIGSFVEEAYSLLRNRDNGLPTNIFYEILYDAVGEREDLTRETVKYLHHAFHWAFYNDRRDLPFAFDNKAKLSIRIADNLKFVSLRELSDWIFETQGGYLRARAREARKKSEPTPDLHGSV